MARIRQARRCRARRTDGQPCGAYAIVGGTVCRAHGGSALQVRHAAALALAEASARRQFAVVLARHRREWIRWQANRIAVTSLLLGIPWQQVTAMDIVFCHVQYGQPALDDTAPKVRRDRRFGPRSPNS